MKYTSYQIDLPENPDVVVFYNGIKAHNLKGLVWLWQEILTSNLTDINQVKGCIQAKSSISSYREVIIVSYWENEARLNEFFHSPLHHQMMKSMMNIIATAPQAISSFNETYHPLRSGKYFNQPQGLARIYPAINQLQLTTK
jgi:heme-degrading monooxygenase HmoA